MGKTVVVALVLGSLILLIVKVVRIFQGKESGCSCEGCDSRTCDKR